MTTTPKVSYIVSVCQTGTSTKLTSMKVGQVFDLVLSVQDLRPSGTWNGTKRVNGIDVTGMWPLVRGVYAAYCDVLYDKSLAKLVFYDDRHPQSFIGCFKFTDGYVNGPPQAFDAPDRINDVGAFTSSFGGNTAPVEVWRATMIAKKAGSLVFQPDLSDVSHPKCDTLVYGNDSVSPPEPSCVPASEVVLVPCAVTVSPATS
jgi:hypothetical protein